MLFRMVPKLTRISTDGVFSFRAVLFRMVPKPRFFDIIISKGFRAVLFRMVPKLSRWYDCRI
ncbi:hypothetical protein HMPREF1512_2122 [Streptococcus sp. OBRC6]|nr:hypothetical protein HMPREF1512_2122 [Streptococcus sp. OBRC6]